MTVIHRLKIDPIYPPTDKTGKSQSAKNANKAQQSGAEVGSH